VKDPAAASLNCSLATMANVTEALPPHCNVALVQGAGLLGLHGCALLRTAGVSRVLVSDPNPARLATALRFGGEPVNPGDLPSDCADVVIEVAGAPGLFEEAVRILRPGGHYLLAGGVHPHSRIETETEILIRKYLTVKGFHNYADRHLFRAAEFLALSDLPWDSLVSPAFSIWNLDEAFVAARSGMWARVAVRLST
jgi:threonine dehydrogenase-like Zn-dependent dehydrogenase